MTFLNARVRGFRVVEIGALSVLLCLVVGVYLTKTGAGHERTEIARVEQEIVAERARIRLLQAEVAHLESPERLERLAVQHLGLAPVAATRETAVETLPQVARGENPATARPGAPR